MAAFSVIRSFFRERSDLSQAWQGAVQGSGFWSPFGKMNSAAVEQQLEQKSLSGGSQHLERWVGVGRAHELSCFQWIWPFVIIVIIIWHRGRRHLL